MSVTSSKVSYGKKVAECRNIKCHFKKKWESNMSINNNISHIDIFDRCGSKIFFYTLDLSIHTYGDILADNAIMKLKMVVLLPMNVLIDW